MKTAAFFDVDNTLVDGYTQILLAKYLIKRKELSLLSYVRILTWYFSYIFKFTKDSSSIRDKSVKILLGWKREKLLGLARECFECYIKPKIFPEAYDLIKEHAGNNRVIILASSSLDPLVDIIKEYFRADIALCTKLEIVGGEYTGSVVGGGMTGKRKASLIKKISDKENIDLQASYAYTDHISDLPMLELVGNPTAINPNGALTKICRQRNWKIVRFKNARAN